MTRDNFSALGRALAKIDAKTMHCLISAYKRQARNIIEDRDTFTSKRSERIAERYWRRYFPSPHR
jgi:hypothetical protein